MLTPWKESYDQARQHIPKQRYYFANKGPSSQGYGFSCGHVWMWELNCEEIWAPKNWCFWTVALEKTLGSPLDCKEIQPVHSKGDQPSGCSLEGMMLKLKLQYFGYLMQRVGHNWATELNWTEGLARVRGSGSNYLPTILRVLQYFRCRSWILALLPYVSISLKWESWAERQTSRRREPLLWWASACANSRWLWCSPLKTFLNQQAES